MHFRQSVPSVDFLKVMAVLAFLIFTSGCERRVHITEGSFQGLEIGMTKAEVRAALVQQGVHSILPEVEDEIEINVNSMSNLYLLNQASGICINGKSGFVLNIAFDAEGMASVLYSSVDMNAIALNIQKSKNRKEVLDNIPEILRSNPNLRVLNCVPGNVVNIVRPSSADLDNLEKINSWFYYSPHGYSTATLKFRSGKLIAIDYVLRSHETP